MFMSAAAPSPTTSAWPLAGRFARFIGALREAMAIRAEHNPILMAIAARLWNRLTEAAERFAAIAAHPVARSRRRPAERPPTPTDAPPAGPPPQPRRTLARRTLARRTQPRRTLPRGQGWLARMAPELVPFGIDFADLLAQPEMTELLATAPRLGRLLRPLCRMFAITPPGSPTASAGPAPAARATGSARPRPPPPAVRSRRNPGLRSAGISPAAFCPLGRARRSRVDIVTISKQ